MYLAREHTLALNLSRANGVDRLYSIAMVELLMAQLCPLAWGRRSRVGSDTATPSIIRSNSAKLLDESARLRESELTCQLE
jgi:hypothetical protein